LNNFHLANSLSYQGQFHPLKSLQFGLGRSHNVCRALSNLQNDIKIMLIRGL